MRYTLSVRVSHIQRLVVDAPSQLAAEDSVIQCFREELDPADGSWTAQVESINPIEGEKENE